MAIFVKKALRTRLAKICNGLHRGVIQSDILPNVYNINRLLRPLDRIKRPNRNALTKAVRDNSILALNVKAMGYELARQLAANLPDIQASEPVTVRLPSKLATQADIESTWLRYWCRELKVPVLYHRKLWELCYVLQVLHDHDCLKAPRRGLGFGCGREPIPSYLAARGIKTTVTDLPLEDHRATEWSGTRQHASSIEHMCHTHLVERERFEEYVALRPVDMNALPDDLGGYDFCWSICALEHLGSIQKGLDFIEASLRTLRPGGVAVHTLEFNLNPEGETIDNWLTVLFQRRHIEKLASRLRKAGHQVQALDFDPGNGPMDRFVDLPPWADGTMRALVEALGTPQHLKLGIDGFVCTCFAISIINSG